MELVYNYGIKSYSPGNHIQFIALELIDLDNLEISLKLSNYSYEKIDNYLNLKGPDLINFHIYDSKTCNRFLVNLGMIVFMPQNLRYLAI